MITPPALIEHTLVEHNRGAVGPSIADYWGSDYWHLGCHAQAIAAYAPCEAVFQQITSRSYLVRLSDNQRLAYREMGKAERIRERDDIDQQVNEVNEVGATTEK